MSIQTETRKPSFKIERRQKTLDPARRVGSGFAGFGGSALPDCRGMKGSEAIYKSQKILYELYLVLTVQPN
jgi:hypothetical protein